MTSDIGNEPDHPTVPLAIVGMSCRLPGADNTDDYWELIRSGSSGIGEMPERRLNRELYHTTKREEWAKTYSTISGMIPPRKGDPLASLRELSGEGLSWDPCHEILCGVVDEARADANWSKDHFASNRTGIYVGHSSGSEIGAELVLGCMAPEVADRLGDLEALRSLSEGQRRELLTRFVRSIQSQRPARTERTKIEPSYAAQLISRQFGLDGPQMVIDAACASSMIALALASAALTLNEIDVAVVASASYAKADSLVLFSQAQSCSATKSRPFDAKADGLVNAEGYVTILVKTLARAQEDGDRIHAVIRGIGISSDGKGRSLWAPRKEGQFEAVRRAYSKSVSIDSVQYVEAHATSTQIGDATELEALALCFRESNRQQKIPLGSVKSNIGHTLESAGLAGLLKTVLCMQKGVIPPTINLTELNPTVDWKEHPLVPVTSTMPWPDVPGHPRRAAVNSFGIGGLNAHVIVDGPLEPSRSRGVGRGADTVARSTAKPKNGHSGASSCPLAIIGRGLIVPGAFGIKSFEKLVSTGESQLCRPPENRWRGSNLESNRPTTPEDGKKEWGGYVRDYEYDWRKHKIPPKQIAYANPLQFMLLDAAQQALNESGYFEREFARERTSVVVGTPFSGEFAHQQIVGLRLPQILFDLEKVVGSSFPDLAELLQEAEAHILKTYPALQDQTGSFTSSTQASRVAKTLNVMGGAMAIDSGDCSSLAALQSAKQLLATGTSDFVFCASAQRALDAVAFEGWNLRSPDSLCDFKSDGTSKRIFPGEGVVVLLLRRLDDAIQQGDKIFGVIREVHASRNNSDSPSAVTGGRAGRSLPGGGNRKRVPQVSSLVHQFGHLQAAQGLLDILGATVSASSAKTANSQTVIQAANDQCFFAATVESFPTAKPAEIPEKQIKTTLVTKLTSHDQNRTRQTPSSLNDLPSSHSAVPIEVPMKTAMMSNEFKRLCCWGVDEGELLTRLNSLDFSSSANHDSVASPRIPAHAPFRMSIVANQKEWPRKQQIASEFLQNGGAQARLQDQGIFYRGPMNATTPKLAFLFPGQGSQKVGMLSDLIQTSESAVNRLREIDRLLMRSGDAPCSQWIFSDNQEVEENLESTQVAMLAADLCAWEIVKDWGLEPDYLLGHSFGEYAALVSAGVIDIAAAVSITLARAQAVSECHDAEGAMLSIGAKVKQIRTLLGRRSGLFLSHINSPQQTVVAGGTREVREFAAELKKHGIPSLEVAVASPFHTPLLASAQPKLQIALGQHRWRPPRVPVLSSVSGRFVADRNEMVDNLTQQLTLPLNWVANIERLLEEDVQVFLEVGPGRVLTKLTQQTIGDRQAFSLAIDDSKLSPIERELRIQAALETAGISNSAYALSAVRASNRLPKNAATPALEAPSQSGQPIIEGERASDAFVKQAALVAPSSDVKPNRSLVDFLIDLVVEQTGFARDQIELDRDLEEELGIDPTRKAQILGELQEYFDLPPESRNDQLSEVRTLRDLLQMLETAAGKSEWLLVSAEKSQVSNRPLSGSLSISVPSSPAPLVAAAIDDAKMDEFLIDFVVERTGYPRDVVELDVDLEADLGIDSIAKAQLIGEVRDQFELTIDETAARSILGEIRTLRQIRDMMGSITVKSANPTVKAIDEKLEPLSGEEWRSDGLSDEPPNDTGNSPDNYDAPSPPSNTNGSTRHSSSSPDSAHQAAFQRGVEWGTANRESLRNQLFDRADQFGSAQMTSAATAVIGDEPELSSIEIAEYRGVAQGAEVHEFGVIALRPNLESEAADVGGAPSIDVEEADDNSIEDGESIAAPLTQRFRLEMSQPENRQWSARKPPFAGGSIVVGNNRDCEELVKRLESLGQKVAWFREAQAESIEKLEQLWETTPSPHLFIMTPRDSTAKTCLDEDRWKHRRDVGVSTIFWFCQKWIALAEKSNLLDDASIVGVLSMGGDFGISQRVESAESGAISGLLKAIMIETWVNGHRTTPIKLLDFPVDSAPASIADAIFVELDEPSYDVEIGWKGSSRSVLRSTPHALPSKPAKKLVPEGNWLVTGGARGITAFLVKQLAGRYSNIHFHLIGTASVPQITDEQRSLAKSALSQLRTQCMQEAKAKSLSPIKAWQKLEKAIEIDQTLRDLKSHGARVSYHSADVANLSELGEVVSQIRTTFGPISGVIHGAGIGKDAGFQRKEQEMVDRCLSAKLDGAVNLMSLTQKDELQAWIGFGSISGRFGANGHTDYSLANDMLAKLTTWYRNHRPDVPTAVFHWHAWDDIGMATKPETRLALEMIGMKLMPAAEGAEHFLREIDAGLPLAEVLITDTRYYRLFYPADRMVSEETSSASDQGYAQGSLILSQQVEADQTIIGHAELNPITDPFLKEHRLRDRPLLPMVIMVELLLEGAAVAKNNWRSLVLEDFEIATSLKFPTDAPCAVEVFAKEIADGQLTTELRADFHSRAGKLVSANRLYAKGNVQFGLDVSVTSSRDLPKLAGVHWHKPVYPDATSVFYVGNPFRCLKRFAIDESNQIIYGQIIAPSIGELAGAERDVAGWLTPSAILDATLYTSGILGWKCVRPGVMLPQRVKKMTFLRRPRPAETCLVQSNLVRVSETECVFDIMVWGSDGKPVFVVENYVAAWLPS